jgi:hypothetical protein
VSHEADSRSLRGASRWKRPPHTGGTGDPRLAATLEAALLESWQSAGTLAHVWGQRPTCVLTRAHARRSPRSHGEHAALPRDDGCALEVACARAILRSEPRDIRIDRATGAVHAHLQRRRSRRPRWRVCARRCTRRRGRRVRRAPAAHGAAENQGSEGGGNAARAPTAVRASRVRSELCQSTGHGASGHNTRIGR